MKGLVLDRADFQGLPESHPSPLP